MLLQCLLQHCYSIKIIYFLKSQGPTPLDPPLCCESIRPTRYPPEVIFYFLIDAWRLLILQRKKECKIIFYP
jgi:hypothetical protein